MCKTERTREQRHRNASREDVNVTGRQCRRDSIPSVFESPSKSLHSLKNSTFKNYKKITNFNEFKTANEFYYFILSTFLLLTHQFNEYANRNLQ